MSQRQRKRRVDRWLACKSSCDMSGKRTRSSSASTSVILFLRTSGDNLLVASAGDWYAHSMTASNTLRSLHSCRERERLKPVPQQVWDESL